MALSDPEVTALSLLQGARPGNSGAAQCRVGASETGLLLGDVGHVGEGPRRRTERTCRGPRAVPKDPAAAPEGAAATESEAWRRWRSERALVGAGSATPAGQSEAEATRARGPPGVQARTPGVQARTVGEPLALGPGVYLDRLPDRPTLATESIHA